MSHSIDPARWEQIKNVVRSLYINKGHPLEGPDGVVKLMEIQHNFKAT